MNRLKNLLRNINYLTKHSLWDQREEDIVYLTNKILDDGIYEYSLELDNYKKLKILNKNESVELILNSGKSFVRFGDGEIHLMQGLDQPFQKYEIEIARRLYHILENPRKDLLVALNREYYIPGYIRGNDSFMRRNSYDFRCFFKKYCGDETRYIDAACTFGGWGDRSESAYNFWNLWKEAFKDRSIAIVCGKHILDKLEYDIFELAKSKQFIYGPKKNAWDEHEKIIEKIKKIDRQTIIVFILGMAGKAMIPEVADLGYVAWDVGHLAKSYNAFMTNMQVTPENIANFYAPD